MSLIDNERTKLLANALDRASTASLAVGVFGPIAVTLYNAGGPFADDRAIILAVGSALWLTAAVALHLVARAVLGRME